MARLTVRCSTLHAARQQIATRARSATELTQAYLRGLRSVEPAVQSFIMVDEEGALEQAAEVDRRVAAGEHLPLAGVPIAIKVGKPAPSQRTIPGLAVCVLVCCLHCRNRGSGCAPLMTQDNLCTKGLQTTAGSKQLRGYLPPYDATAVARLRAAGAVLVGKTNMDEVWLGGAKLPMPPSHRLKLLLSQAAR